MTFPRFPALAVATLLLASAAPAPAALADGAFLTECEDLPLAPGLTEQPGGTLFESPTGRLVEATAEGQVSALAVRRFYAEALPQLGWEKTADAVFHRDSEALRIDIDEHQGAVSVRFSVAPR